MKSHLKTYRSPVSWADMPRKTLKYITRPSAGPHSLEMGMSMAEWLKRIGVAKTRREVVKVLNMTEVLVDGRRVKDKKFIVGFMDVITLADGRSFRVVFDEHGQLRLEETKDNKSKSCRVIGKTVLSEGKVQINLSDGRNILVKDAPHKIGDTVVIEIPSQKVKKHLKLESGAKVILIGGKYRGRQGIIEEVRGDLITYKKNKEVVQTLKKYAFVLP